MPMMSRSIAGRFMIIFVCVLFFMMIVLMFVSCGRDDKLPADVAYIKGRLDQIEHDVKARDSVLMQKIEDSYERINDLSRIRKMTEKQIDSLAAVITDERKKLDEMKQNLLSW